MKLSLEIMILIFRSEIPQNMIFVPFMFWDIFPFFYFIEEIYIITIRSTINVMLGVESHGTILATDPQAVELVLLS